MDWSMHGLVKLAGSTGLVRTYVRISGMGSVFDFFPLFSREKVI
jgi:hypothetical protein